MNCLYGNTFISKYLFIDIIWHKTLHYSLKLNNNNNFPSDFEHLVWCWWYRNVSYVWKKLFFFFYIFCVLILCSTWCRLKKLEIFYELQQRDYQTNKDMSFISWFLFFETIKIQIFCYEVPTTGSSLIFSCLFRT